MTAKQIEPITILSITAKKEINFTGSSVMEAPDALRDVENYYNEIDRPHVVISLLTSSAKSPTGKNSQVDPDSDERRASIRRTPRR